MHSAWESLMSYQLSKLCLTPLPRNIWSLKKIHNHRALSKLPIGCSFTTVYRLPFIGACALFNKCKKWQIITVSAAIPSSYLCYLNELCGDDIPLAISVVGLASTAALFTVGHCFTGLIGYTYISNTRKKIKISYLDFWGNRRDLLLDPQSILPLANSSKIMDSFYKTVNISTELEPYKLSLKYGEVDSPRLFKHIFKYDIDEHEYIKCK